MTPEEQAFLDERNALATQFQYLPLRVVLAWKDRCNLPMNASDIDEAELEGKLALVRASRRYKADAGWKFITFAWTCIWNGLSDWYFHYARLVRIERRGKVPGKITARGASPECRYLRFNDDGSNHPLVEDDGPRALETAEEVERLLAEVDALPDDFREAIVEHYLHERTYLQIAEGEGYGRTRQRVQQRANAGLRLLRVQMGAV